MHISLLRIRHVALLAVALLLWTLPAEAQERDRSFPRVSPSATVSQTVGVTEITITYGRPSVREREIFGGLVPYDQVWRAGADEATTITFTDDVRVEGQPLEAGTYGLFTIPGEEEWTVIFNAEPTQWGAYEYDPEQDVLRVQVAPRQAEHQEQLAYRFEDVNRTSATVVLHWAEVAVPFQVRVDTDAAVAERARAAAREAEDWRLPYQYASYAMQNELYQDEVMDWVEASIEQQPTYQNLALKARLHARQGNYVAAIEAGERALELGRAQDSPPRGLEELEQEVEGWREQQ